MIPCGKSAGAAAFAKAACALLHLRILGSFLAVVSGGPLLAQQSPPGPLGTERFIVPEPQDPSSARIELPPPGDPFLKTNPTAASGGEAQELQADQDTTAKEKKPTKTEAKTETKTDAKVGTKPSYPTVKVSGFFQADAGWFTQDAANRALLGDIQDGADFRRARLGASGDLAENVSYFMEYDFAFPGRPNFMDHVVDIKDTFLLGNFRAGYWRQPICLDALTSVRELTFLERALPFALIPFRQIGAGFYDMADDGSGTWAVSAVRFPTDVYGGNIGDDGGYGLVSRITSLPFFCSDDSQLLHLGAGYAYLDPANDIVFYRSQPEFFVAETGLPEILPEGVPIFVPFFVNTGSIYANQSQIFNAEAAAIWHNWHAQSEVIYAAVNPIGSPTAVMWGGYGQVACILTGEHRAYNHKAGTLGRVIPRVPFGRCCGWGAWELAFRWSHLDLNDGVVAGGRLNDLTAGLNWYLNQYTKFQFNYIRAMLDTPGVGDSDADICAVRAQIDF